MDWSQAANILGTLAAAVALLGTAIVTIRFMFRPKRKEPLLTATPFTPEHPPVENKTAKKDHSR